MRALLLFLFGLALSPNVTAQNAVEIEASGLEAAATTPPPPHQPLPEALGGGTAVLMIPESTNDNVIVLDATTGDLLSTAFLADNTGLSTPINAVPSVTGSGILICDQIADAVYQYSGTGEALGLFAPAGGVNTAILDNVRGCTTSGQDFWVTSAGSANNAVASFSSAGVYQGNLIDPGVGGLDGPFDVLLFDNDLLVSSINSDNILRYTRAGAFLSVFAAGVPFTEQLAESAAGNVLAAEFTNNVINEYPPAGGTPLASYSFPGLGGFRGVYELPSGNLIVTTGTGVHEVQRPSTVVRTIVADVSARFVERIPDGFIVATEPPSPVSGASLRLAGANPAAGHATLELRVPTSQHVTVEAFDGTGRRVAVLHDGVATEGTVHMLGLRSTGLPAGAYAIRAIGETFVLTQTVTLVR